MRILTVTHFFENHGGGIERVAGHLCRQFARLGATPVWAASDADEPPGEIIEALPLRCFNPTERLTGLPMPIPDIRAMRALAREIRHSDAVIIHDALYFTSIVALLIAKARGKRVLLVQHIAGIPFSSRILRSIMHVANVLVTRPMLRATDARVFISEPVRDEILGESVQRSSELLFNGIDNTIFHPVDDRELAPPARPEIEAPGGVRRILFVGRYVEKKGLTILRALAELRPDLEFFLAGSGPVRPSDWGLGNVHDLGLQSQRALARLYRWGDLLLLPSVGEGYPLVIQEAMACGLPVICGSPSNRADPEAAHWLRGVKIDLSDPTGSAERCSGAIDQFSPSAAERDEMARFALRKYDWGKMAERLLELAGGPRALVRSPDRGRTLKRKAH